MQARRKSSPKRLILAAAAVIIAAAGLYAVTGGSGHKTQTASASIPSTPPLVTGSVAALKVSSPTSAPSLPTPPTPQLAALNTTPAPSPASAGAAVTNAGGPKIQFATPVYDFGKVNGGEVVKYSYIFTNTGCGLLVISNVHPSCGCTTAGEWTRQVESGQTGSIPIQFNSGNFSGPVVKTVTVTCNDPSQPTTVLQIKGTLWRPIDIMPQVAFLNLTADTPSNATSVRIVNNLDQPVTLSDLQINTSSLAAELITNEPGKKYEVIVKTVPPWPTNNIQAQITLKTSSTQMSNLTFTAWASVQPVVTVTPSPLMLPAGPLTNQQTQTLWIRNNGTNTLALSEPASNAKDVGVQMTEGQPGRFFTVALTFPAGFDIPQGQKIEFTVKTTHPQFPVLKVPIMQLPRPMPAAAGQ